MPLDPVTAGPSQTAAGLRACGPALLRYGIVRLRRRSGRSRLGEIKMTWHGSRASHTRAMSKSAPSENWVSISLGRLDATEWGGSRS